MTVNDEWIEYLHFGRVLISWERDLLRRLFLDVAVGKLTHEEASKIRRDNGILLRSEQHEQEKSTPAG
jgi:hypothetical protein